MIFIWVLLLILFIALLYFLIQKRNLYVYKIYDNNLKRINKYHLYLIDKGIVKFKETNVYEDTMYNYKFAVFNLFLWHPDKFIKKWFRKDLLKFEKDNK